MGFLQDAIAVFKKRELVLIDSRRESDDVYTFTFDKPSGLIWKAGQHGLFTITNKSVKNGTRPFTVSSAPAENVVKLTMRIGDNPSEFKSAMLELKPGMKISMSGPLGAFHLQDGSPSLLIAGGIGITPFRAMLRQAAADGGSVKDPIQLLYLDSKQCYLFKDELDELASRAGISVTYLDSRDGLQREIDQFTALHKEDGSMFIAGPKAMVDSITAYLKDRNVPKRNIKKDVFIGYK